MKEYLMGGFFGLIFISLLFWLSFVMETTKNDGCKKRNLSEFQQIACFVVKYPSNLPPITIHPMP